MRIPFLTSTIIALTIAAAEAKQPVDYVNPFIGTDGIVHTFPGATVPFGMIQLSPDGDITGWNWCSGYHTSDSSIMGFSHNHLSGTGWSDLADILIMPTVGTVKTSPGTKADPDAGYRSRISHDSKHEQAAAGYYMVDLLDYGVRAELTATDRVGIHKYTFPAADSANIIIDPAHKIFGEVFDTQISALNDSTLQGWCSSTGWGGERTVWFTAVFSRPFDKVVAGKKGYVQYFNTAANEVVEVKVALSHVSQQGADMNLETASDIDFATARSSARKAWNDRLSAYQFKGTDQSQMEILYTGLYHAFLQPNLNMDVDNKYVAGGIARTSNMKGKIYTADGFTNYSTFSLWDTFRASNQLLTITDNETLVQLIRSLISRYENGDHLPLWELLGFDNTCMIGYPAVAIIGDAIMKDIPGFDYQTAYAAMRDAAFTPHISSSDGPSGTEQYILMGYVPSEIPVSVAKTMEYSYYDWIIAQVAKKLGKTEDAELFTRRSMGFLNHWNAEKGLMWPKNSKGEWVDQNVRDWTSLQKNYVSGNIYAYSYFYPHAIDTMITIMGGHEKFIESMENILTTPMDMDGDQHLDISGFVGRYAHGDEPGHQFLYMFNAAGSPEKIAPWLHNVSNEYYNNSRNGMPNNDDCGQMSAWYIFSSMGFYPMCPGDSRYYIGAPMMNEASIKTSSGKIFTMKASNYSPKNIYIQSATLNGKPLARGYITHHEIMNGGTLVFTMGAKEKKFL